MLDNDSLDLKKAVDRGHPAGLWQLLAGYRLLYAGALVAVALGAFVRAGYFQLVQRVIDQVSSTGMHSGRLALAALAFVGLAVLEGVLAFVRGIWSAQAAEHVAQRLRNYLYDHIQRLPFAFHDYVKAGELIQRSTSDVDALRRFYADQALGVGRIIALFSVNLVALARINTTLAGGAVVVLPAIVAVSYFFFGRVSAAYERYQEQEARLSTVLQENLSGVRVVRAFARQRFEIEKFDRENWERYRRGRKLTLMHSLYWPLSDILCSAQTVIAMALASGMVVRGTITIGQYIAAMGLVGWIIWPMRNLGRLIVQISTGLVSYRRVTDVVASDREDVTSGSVSADTEVRGAVTFDHVGFSYTPQAVLAEPDKRSRGARRNRPQAVTSTPVSGEPIPVLHDISFACPAGSVVALLGSTGSGKTSIINLLLRYYDRTAGRITLDGVDLQEYPREFLRRCIGIVEQEPFLFSRSIRDNIAYGALHPVSQEQIEDAARAAAIHEIILTFPAGYETIVGEKGVTLSGGQRQRVAIARAILRNPRVLVLDDATSSVDTETAEQISEALTKLMPGRTTFIVAHRIQSVMAADLILVLDQGRIVQSGTHTSLIGQYGLYRDIYDLQSRIAEEVHTEVAIDGRGESAAPQGMAC